MLIRVLAVVLSLGVFLGMAGCGERPKARKKTKHDDHWHYEDEKHDDAKDKDKDKAEKTEKK